MKNINLSYSNSPVCEYIGSKIYELVGLPVHNTILGTRNGKIVVACEDFLKDGDRLYEFDKIKVTFEPHFRSRGTFLEYVCNGCLNWKYRS